MARQTHDRNDEFVDENRRAIREAREADRVEPRAHAATYDAEQALVFVRLRNGYAFGFAPEHVRGLEDASTHQLSNVGISPSGDGLHWHDLDVHASLTGLMEEALNLREWAPRIMGRARSDAKTRAARANGRKGGRPRRSGAEAAPK